MPIVVAPGVVVSLGGSPDADAPLIGYDSLLSSSSVSASSEATNKPITLALNSSTAQRWEGSSAVDQTITAELNGVDEIDYVGIAAHNLGTIGATVSIEGATTVDTADNPEYSDLEVDTLPGDDCALLFRFTKAPYQYLRITISLPTGATVAPFIGILYAGELLQFQRNIYVGHRPITLARNNVITTGVSESGEFLGRVRTREMLRTEVTVDNVEPAWYRANIDPFAEQAVLSPFFWAWRPYTYPQEVVFGWIRGDIQPSNALPNGYMSFQLDMEAISC